MNDSIKRISLDIHKVSASETVNTKRGDSGRTIHISLVDGGVPYIISKDCYAVFTAKKPDGKVVYNDCTIENNTITYEITEQTVAVEGKVNCEIKLYGADKKLITSPKFTIFVYGTVYDDGDEVESSDEFNALTSLMADTQKAVKEAQDAVADAQEAINAAQEVGKNTVKYTPQNLTPEQQAQARQNIGAINARQLKSIADATAGITTALLDALYAPAYYSTLAGAVADLNGATIGMNAEPTAKNAVCALYEDFDGNTCLVLLADVESTELTTFSESVIFKINGHTLSLPDSAKIKFSGDNSVIDGRVEGSCITKKAKVISSNLPVIDMTGTNTQILSVVFDMTIESATAMIAAILARSECVTDGIKISVKVNGGNATIYNAMTQSGGVLKMRKSKIVLNSLSAGTAAGVKAQSSGKGLYLDQCEITVDQEDGTVCGIADSMPEFSSFYDTDITCCTRNGSAYSLSKDTGEANIDKCKLYSSATTGSAVSLNLHTQNSKVSAQKSVFFSDGTTGSVNDNEKAISIGVTNYGHLTLDDCAVYGTHSGMQCSEGSTTIVNGGVYEGVGHGGLYLACVDGNFYGQNATFRAAPYRGKFKDLFNYSRTYLVAAVYIGGGEDNNNIKAYMDNCVFDGSGPCVYESSDGKPQGAEPIRFRGSLGEQNNAIYASNCTFMGDGQIRFINDTHRLYLGFGNRLLCEATIPACVDSTTYAGKVFTNYEEG